MSGQQGEGGGVMAVFLDKKNYDDLDGLDEEYAEKCRQELRVQLDWEVKEGTPSHINITKFSKGYCREKRDVSEVVGIFRIMEGLV